MQDQPLAFRQKYWLLGGEMQHSGKEGRSCTAGMGKKMIQKCINDHGPNIAMLEVSNLTPVCTRAGFDFITYRKLKKLPLCRQ